MGEVASEFLLLVAGAVEVRTEGIALRIAETFTYGNNDTAEIPIDACDIGADLFEGGRVLRKVNEMGCVAGARARQSSGAYDPSGIAADDFDNCDGRRQGPVVGADIAEGVGIEAGGRTEARAVVSADEIVVDSFGNADDREGTGLVKEEGGLHGPVAAGEEHRTDSLLPAASARRGKVDLFEGLPRGPQDGARRAADLREDFGRKSPEVDPIVTLQAVGPASRPVEPAKMAGSAATVNDSDQAGIENGSGSTAMDNDGGVREFTHSPSLYFGDLAIVLSRKLGG